MCMLLRIPADIRSLCWNTVDSIREEKGEEKGEEKTDVTNKDEGGQKDCQKSNLTTETTTETISLLIKDNPKITGKELAAITSPLWISSSV